MIPESVQTMSPCVCSECIVAATNASAPRVSMFNAHLSFLPAPLLLLPTLHHPVVA